MTIDFELLAKRAYEKEGENFGEYLRGLALKDIVDAGDPVIVMFWFDNELLATVQGIPSHVDNKRWIVKGDNARAYPMYCDSTYLVSQEPLTLMVVF